MGITCVEKARFTKLRSTGFSANTPPKSEVPWGIKHCLFIRESRIINYIPIERGENTYPEAVHTTPLATALALPIDFMSFSYLLSAILSGWLGRLVGSV